MRHSSLFSTLFVSPLSLLCGFALSIATALPTVAQAQANTIVDGVYAGKIFLGQGVSNAVDSRKFCPAVLAAVGKGAKDAEISLKRKGSTLLVSAVVPRYNRKKKFKVTLPITVLVEGAGEMADKSFNAKPVNPKFKRATDVVAVTSTVDELNQPAIIFTLTAFDNLRTSGDCVYGFGGELRKIR